MPQEKTYVHVANIGVGKAFDSKYKSSLPKVMKAAAEKAINKSSKLTTKPSKDKKAKAFYLDGNLFKLNKVTKGNKETIEGEIKLQLADFPKKSMWGFASSSGKLPDPNPRRIDKDVEWLVAEIVETAVKKDVVKAFEAKIK